MKNTTEAVLQDLINLAKQDCQIRADKGLSLLSRGAIDYDTTNRKVKELAFGCASESGVPSAYEIKIKYSRGRIASYCTCLDFAQGNVCKHIRAAAYFATKNPEIVSSLLKIKIIESEKNVISKTKNVANTMDVVVPKIAVNNEYRKFRFYDLANFYYFVNYLPTIIEQDLAKNFEKYLRIITVSKGYIEIELSHKNVKVKLELTTTPDPDMVNIKCNSISTTKDFYQIILLHYINNNKGQLILTLQKLDIALSNAYDKLGIQEQLRKYFPLELDLRGVYQLATNDDQSIGLLNLISAENIFLKTQKSAVPTTIALKNQKQDYNFIFFGIVKNNSPFGFYFMPLTGKCTKNGVLAKKFFGFDKSTVLSYLEESEETIAVARRLRAELENDHLEDLEDYYNRANLQGREDFYKAPHQTVYDYWLQIAQHNHIYINDGDGERYNFEKIILNPELINVRFEIEQVNKKIHIRPVFTILVEDVVIEIDIKFDHFVHGALVKYTGVYYLVAKHSMLILKNFISQDYNDFQIDTKVYLEVKDQLLESLMARHQVNFITPSLKPQTAKAELVGKKLYLKEYEDFLMLVPAFIYEYEGKNYEAEMDGAKMIKLVRDKQTIFIERDWETEAQVRKDLQMIHPAFCRQLYNHYFHVEHQEVLANNWFFNAFEKIKNLDFEILGIKDLKKLKYSPYKAKVKVSAGSGLDWFDLAIEMTFGEEKVSLTDLRKALFNNQKFVTLSNGSIGMLPEEWIAKYEHIIKGGKIKKEKIEFGQIQYGLIDHLYQEIDNNSTLIKFHQKRQKLLSFDTIAHKALPTNINASLRDYQIGGFQWLSFLDEFGWGGCLADDMGLGKTLQMLTFIQSKVNEKADLKVLVVVPASLIFNWQRESEKFTPELRILNQTGGAREKDLELFKQYHIILTTYASMRIDIATLKDYPFDYVILDESQAIKNPSSQTAKAAKILKAKNRLIMTGTPIENNTFDLYSQFDFLNPGLLGSIEYFRTQFATPIDKDRNEQAAEALRRLIYPFIISRKKEQVAKELPPKTETVIICEMGKLQRKVYDTYKKKIREDLSKTIEEQGLAKSGIAVLQGLTKLRQICNSPSLLSDEEINVTESVKLETLMENIVPIIEEKHKVLVFSFFVEMLELVKSRLQKEHIQFAWITGQTTQREQQVQTFQQDENCKVFLISLKAGGVGLNLTAADYVYLIDPWWNPAVEQQAIDRAHRIGQTQNVFAYKMICKDTIEEKILQLQEKKKAVANELVNIEQGVLKKLSKDDVLTLFE